MAPPEPMPNSVVKRNSADGSVGSPHVRVGHRQALIKSCFYIASFDACDAHIPMYAALLSSKSTA